MLKFIKNEQKNKIKMYNLKTNKKDGENKSI